MRRSSLWLAVWVLSCGEPPVSSMDAAVDEDDAGFVSTDAGMSSIDSGMSSVDAGLIIDAGVSVDAGTDAGVIVPPDAGTPGRIVYGFDSLQSPMSNDVVAHLQAIAALGAGKRDEVFSKIGDSQTVSTNFLQCFAGTHVDLATRTDLESTRAFFDAAMVGNTTPFERTSLSATVGWSASAALAGNPSPLQQEIDAAQPRFATVMFGTNDVGNQNVDSFTRNMFTIADTLAMQGVIPILSSVPRRDDSTTADAWVPRYNLAARGIAQARKVPFIDLHQALETVTSHGLGGDGVHLNVYSQGGSRGCVMTSAGLDFGSNVRNLLTLDALDRARKGTVLDVNPPRRSGSGLPGDEIQVSGLPFVDVRDTRVDGASNFARYDSCSSTNEGGPEVLYKLELDHAAHLRIFVVSVGSADVDVQLLSGLDAATQCVARNDKVIVRDVPAGTWWISADTYVGASGALPGEFLIGVMEE